MERDERESGERMLLNLGHTLGHALEAATSYRVFTHGEAVGHGMEFATDLGEALEVTTPESARRVRAALKSVGPGPRLAASMVGPTRRAIDADKKRDGRKLRVILFKRPGRPVMVELGGSAFATLAEAWLGTRVRAVPVPGQASPRAVAR